MEAERYDVIIIGAGQSGVPLARASARAGRKTALIERVHVGGTCINEGCTPSKTMIASARAAHVTRRASHYGVHSSEPTVELRRVRERKQKMVDDFRSGSERRLDAAGVELIRGQARFVGRRTVEVAGSTEVRLVQGDIVVINTGMRPAVPPIPGLSDVPFLTSTSIMELNELPAHLIVLGGGYVGTEFAQMFRRFGSDVTLIQRNVSLLPHEDADVATEVALILRDDGIAIELGANVREVSASSNGMRILYEVDGSDRTAAGTALLVATGRTPNTDDLGLDVAGVETDSKGFIRTSDMLETTADGVYATGDVKGGPAFTHISYDDFRVLTANLLDGEEASITGRILPYTVFIDPELGRIGMTERDAAAAGKRILVATLPMSKVARALEVDETRGFMKAVVDADSQRILGAAILGIEGGEVASLIQVAMMGDLPYTALRDGVFTHPTLAESLNNLFMSLD